MNNALSTTPFLLLATTATALAGGTLALPAGAAAPAPSPGSAAPVYRCGNLYAQVPCPGAVQLHVDDVRTDDERRQREDVTAREKRLAMVLESERQRRERPPPTPARRPPPACTPGKASGTGSRDMSARVDLSCTTPRRQPSKAASASGDWKAIAPAVRR